jgi:hypothetical protein
VSNATKLLISLVLAVFASAGIYLAWLSVAVSNLENALNSLTEASVESTEMATRWLLSAARARQVARLAHWDPAVQDLSGRICLFGAERFGATPKETVAHLRLAKQYLERAALLRPTWPYTKLNLARVEYALDAHGIWKTRLQEALASNLRGTFLQIDLMRFRKQLGVRLSGDLARAVEQNFDQALRDAPEEMIRAARSIGRREWACAQPIDQIVKEICARI